MSYVWTVLITVAVMVLGWVLWILVNQKRWSRMAKIQCAGAASQVITSLWLVDGAPVLEDDCASVKFAHFSWRGWHFILLVCAEHPDIERFRCLGDGDTVEFELVPQGMGCALEDELCGYLRIKSVS